MSGDHLTIEISSSLRSAIGIGDRADGVDYFMLLGLKAESCTEADVDKAVLARSKEVRQWQNSPDYGKEAIGLLSTLHRVAPILKDPQRRDAYARELERLLSGDQADPIEAFRQIVEAAVADGTVDETSREEVFRYARDNNIDEATASEVFEEIAASATRVVEAVPEEKVDIQKGGADEFRKALLLLLSQGRLTKKNAEKAVDQASDFSIPKEEAGEILHDVRVNRFRELIERVANGGVVSNNQARLLMPKAESLALKHELAYEIISEYTFTSASEDDLKEVVLTRPLGFDDADIEDILEGSQPLVYEQVSELPSRKAPSRTFDPAPTIKIVMVMVVVALVLGGGFALIGGMLSGSDKPEPVLTNTQAPPVPVPSSDSQDPAPVGRPDPPSGHLAILSLIEGDPVDFQIKIREVSCQEYEDFLSDSLHTSLPIGWGLDFTFPKGKGDTPVSGISFRDAITYCRWINRRLRLPSGSVRLPQKAEIVRIFREPNGTGAKVGSSEFWDKIELPSDEPVDVTEPGSDVVLIEGQRVYGLFGNVAEWAMDEHDGDRTVYGSDFGRGDKGFDLNATRVLSPETKSPRVGFRYVITSTVPE